MDDIIIVGSGMGGLAAGIDAQRNGFSTSIFEAHSVPGGQCTSWTRMGYVFDPTLHNFNGFKPGTKINDFWKELGALPCDTAVRDEFVSIHFTEGINLNLFNNLRNLESHLRLFAPEDSGLISEYIAGLKSFCTDRDWFGINYFGNIFEKLSLIPFFLARAKYFRYSLQGFADRFKNPYLRRAFPYIRNSITNIPLFAYMAEHASAMTGDVGWPSGGCITLARNMAGAYVAAGGKLNCSKRVVRILTENGRACGIELEDGSVHEARFIISNADGRKTVMNLLGSRYGGKKILSYCDPNPVDAQVHMSVQIFIGVARSLREYPPALLLFMSEPIIIGGLKLDHLDLQIYGFDDSMAPEGCGVIKVELPMKPAYFNSLAGDREAYRAEKKRISEMIISVIDGYFENLREDIDTVDVITLHSWERYMGGSQGFNNFPNKHRSLSDVRNVLDVLFGLGKTDTLPGLKNFYFAGQWVTSIGSLFTNAASGRAVIRKICRRTRRKFR